MTKGKDWVPSTAQFGGLAVAGLVGGIVAVVARLLVAGGADAGDWLQFSGAMLGTGLAVVGAVWIDRKKARDEDNRRKAILADLLVEFRELLCQVTFQEEPSEQAALPYPERFNARARTIDELAALAVTVLAQMRLFDAPNGGLARHVVRFTRELDRRTFISDPAKWRQDQELTGVAWQTRYYEWASSVGPGILEKLDDLVGAFESYGDYDFTERLERKPLTKMKG